MAIRRRDLSNPLAVSKFDDDKKKKPHHKYLTATIREPYVRFGLTGSATDVDFGIRVTY